MQKVTDFIYVLWNPKEKIDPVTDFGQQIADQASTLWDAKKEIEYNLNRPVERMLTSSASIAQGLAGGQCCQIKVLYSGKTVAE